MVPFLKFGVYKYNLDDNAKGLHISPEYLYYFKAFYPLTFAIVLKGKC